MSALNAIPYDTNVSNFVSVKLSGKQNYLLWKAQMLCLLKSVNVCGILDGTFVGPTDSDAETKIQYDNLVRGWIFGSVSEDVLVGVFNIGSAKAVWEKLQSIYDPALFLQEDSPSDNSVANLEREDIDDVSAEINTAEDGTISTNIQLGEYRVSTDRFEEHKKKRLRAATIKGDWSIAGSILKKDKALATKAISSDGSTMLHIAVGIGHNDFVKKLIWYMNDEHVSQQRDSDGSTALHIAAIVDNKHAAELLVKKNRKLLQIMDKNGKGPLQKAFENMHLKIIGHLLKAIHDDRQIELLSFVNDDEFGRRLLVYAISTKQYSLASELVNAFPKFATESDEVLMAIAKTFPSGLELWETLVYPSLENIMEMLGGAAKTTVCLFGFPAYVLYKLLNEKTHSLTFTGGAFALSLLTEPIAMFLSAFSFICLLLLVFCFVLYSVFWKGAKIIFEPFNQIENKMKEWDEAKDFLELVCEEIDKLDYSGTHHPYYTRPILEAACQNAYKVVDEILFRSPDVIQSRDKNGYDIIQLAIITRSEKIYNLIYEIGDRKNLYRTYKDSFGNNLLHLAGRLASTSVLSQRTGAALQLQRELQWQEEIKKLVFPSYITQENKYNETPDMVFTREHENLVREGEQWLKTTSESCSIIAALITTIVFAAAITVPGGSNQEKGTPLFKKEAAFIIFAISNAISLFASTTTLLVFLSIPVARFYEKDFLVSLPRRLFIGLCSLLLATTAMMIAFSATLFLVFCNGNLWMLAPICGLAFIPIAFFLVHQFPLMVDLFWSIYIGNFGKQRNCFLKRFNLDDVWLRWVN